MKTPELVCFWITTAWYLVAFASAIFFVFFAREKLARICTWALRIGCIFHVITFILRWYYAAHVPLSNTYESNLSSSLIAMFIFLALQIIVKNHLAQVAAFASGIVVLVLATGMASDTSLKALSAAYDSYWLFIHVFFAWFAFGCFTVATAFSGVYLTKSYNPKAMTTFYSLEAIDKISYKLVAVGVLFHAVMIVSGAIWAKNLWGHYWSWDPVETWALIAFIGYLVYLHIRSFWKVFGKTAAWMMVLSFIFLLIMFWGLPYIVPNAHLQTPMRK